MKTMDQTREPVFDSNDTCRIAQITNRQLNHWDQLGIVSPSIDLGRGSGNRRAYQLRDVIMLRLARELRKFGIGLDVLIHAIATARREWTSESDAGILAISGDGKAAIHHQIESGFMADSASMIVVRLDRVASEAQRLAGRPGETTQVRTIEVGGRTYQSIVKPVGKANRFEAICNTFPGAQGRGESVDAAMSDLKREITQRIARGTRSVTSGRTPARLRTAKGPLRSTGASTWGDAW